MEITWYGHGCFRITERGQTSVVTDPCQPAAAASERKLRGDLVTVSHHEAERDVAQLIRGQRYVVRGAGEYEVGDLFVTGISLHVYDEGQGRVRDNTAYLFAYPNQLRVLHLGKLWQAPEQATIEQFGEVQVLLVPVDGGRGLGSDQMADVIALVEPNYVVPMHYAPDGSTAEADSVERFLNVMGVSQPEERETLRVTASGLPEQTQVVLLRANLA